MKRIHNNKHDIKKSCIRETNHLSTHANSNTHTQKNLLVNQNSPKKTIFFAWWLYTFYKQKFDNLTPLLSIILPQGFPISKMFGHWTSRSGGKKTLKWSEQMKKSVKKHISPRRFYTTWEKKCSNLKWLPLSQRIPNIQQVWALDFGKWGQKDRWTDNSLLLCAKWLLYN